MTTQLKKTIAPSGGDYTSLEACMNANEQNLVTADKYFDVEISGTWSSADTTAVTIHNYTTDATRYINIYTTGAARHDGKYNTGKYRIEINSSYGACIGIDTGGTYRIDGIQFKNSAADTGDNRGISIVGNNTLWISNVIGYANKTTIRIWTFDGNYRIWNSVLFSNTGECITNLANLRVYSSALIVNSTGSSISSGTLKNVYSTKFNGGTKTTCASADTSGSTGLQNIPYDTTTFTNVTSGSEDLHLVAGSDLIDAGTNTSGDASPMDFTTDIDGETRSGTWDIGASEFVLHNLYLFSNILTIFN